MVTTADFRESACHGICMVSLPMWPPFTWNGQSGRKTSFSRMFRCSPRRAMVSELHWYSRKSRGGAHQAQLARPDAHAQLLRADLEELPQPLPEDPGQPFLQHCPGAAQGRRVPAPAEPTSQDSTAPRAGACSRSPPGRRARGCASSVRAQAGGLKASHGPDAPAPRVRALTGTLRSPSAQGRIFSCSAAVQAARRRCFGSSAGRLQPLQLQQY